MHDLRYAIRFLWIHKSFTATAVLTLAVGLGANTALFGLLNVVTRPMTVPNAEQIVTIAAEVEGDETGGFQFRFSTEQLKDFQERAEPFSDVFGLTPRMGGLADGSRAWQFWFAAVSENYFSALRVSPAAGTLFTSKSGSPVHVVLGYSFWKSRFGADPAVIGRSIRVEGRPAVITGVVEESFRGTLMGIEMDGYVTIDDYAVLEPSAQVWLHDRDVRPIQFFARLKPGVSVADAQAAVDVLMATLATEYPVTDRGIRAAVIPEPLGRPMPMRAVREAIPLVRGFGLAVAALVLLLACMTVGNLLLVRATARPREMAIRAALGASRGRLIGQMLTEGLLLSGLGGVAGYVVGRWVTDTYVSRLDVGADLPLRFDTSFDFRVFLFSLGAAIVAGAVIGLWPAWRASRADARGALHDGGKSTSDGADRQRLRRVLVIGQVSGALALLAVAALFIRTLTSAESIDLGFDADTLISVRLDPKQVGYDDDRMNEFYKELRRRVRAWPDVESVATALAPPMSPLVTGGAIYIEGRPVAPGSQPPSSFTNHVTHDYFATMGIPIVRGRAFIEDEERELSTARKYAIVNETFAAKHWPGEDPIGKRFRLHSTTDPLLEVVGVARDSKYVLVFESQRPYVYLPVASDFSIRTLIVRAAGDPAALGPRLEREVRDLAPDMPMADLQTVSESLGGVFGYLIFRVGAIQVGGMGLLGLILAIVGIYGVVSFGASLRTREIGIRVALGAQARDVLRLILGQGLQLVAAGILIGLVLAVGMSRVLSRFLPLVNATDWMTFAGVALGLAALGLLACYLPARRATRLPVMAALRHE